MNTNDILKEEKALKKKTIKKARFAITVCGFACALMLILQIVCGITFPIVENEIISILVDMIMFVVYLAIPFGLAELILRIIRNKSFYVKKESSFPKAAPLYICGAIGTGYLINLAVNIFFNSWVQSYSFEVALPSTALGLILYFVFQSVFPAIIEEWAFRGIVLKNLLPYGKKGAIFISALFFGIAHIDPPRIIFATIFGIILGMCYEKTGSLKVPMIIHFLNNGIATLGSICANYDALLIINLTLSFLMIGLMGLGIIAIMFYSIAGISKKKYSVNKPFRLGHSLSFGNYARVTVLNLGLVVYLLIFSFYFRLVF